MRPWGHQEVLDGDGYKEEVFACDGSHVDSQLSISSNLVMTFYHGISFSFVIWNMGKAALQSVDVKAMLMMLKVSDQHSQSFLDLVRWDKSKCIHVINVHLKTCSKPHSRCSYLRFWGVYLLLIRGFRKDRRRGGLGRLRKCGDQVRSRGQRGMKCRGGKQTAGKRCSRSISRRKWGWLKDRGETRSNYACVQEEATCVLENILQSSITIKFSKILTVTFTKKFHFESRNIFFPIWFSFPISLIFWMYVAGDLNNSIRHLYDGFFRTYRECHLKSCKGPSLFVCRRY